MRLPIAMAIGVAGVSVSSPAAAVEHENHLGGDLGGSLLAANGGTQIGGAAGAHWTYGITDMFNLMVEGSYSLFALHMTPDATHTHPDWAINADAGVGYVFDVLQWVPYVGALVGGYALSGGGIDGTKVLPGAALAFGVDYRIDTKLQVGIALREHMMFTELSTYPAFTQVLGRVEYDWGF